MNSSPVSISRDGSCCFPADGAVYSASVGSMAGGTKQSTLGFDTHFMGFLGDSMGFHGNFM